MALVVSTVAYLTLLAVGNSVPLAILAAIAVLLAGVVWFVARGDDAAEEGTEQNLIPA